MNDVTPTDHDHLNYRTEWVCEKWSDEACEFVAKRLFDQGIHYQLAGYTRKVRTVFGFSKEFMVPRFIPVGEGITSEMLRKFVGPAEEVLTVHGNLLLNEGIQRLEDLLIAAGGTAYNAANSYIGVGDSSTSETASQTDLQASTNKFYKAMNSTYPSRSSQTVSWQSDFTTAEANYVWNEWTISAGATSASGSGFTVGTTNLNRKVSSLGTKATGTWTLTGQVTIS